MEEEKGFVECHPAARGGRPCALGRWTFLPFVGAFLYALAHAFWAA